MEAHARSARAHTEGVPLSCLWVAILYLYCTFTTSALPESRRAQDLRHVVASNSG